MTGASSARDIVTGRYSDQALGSRRIIRNAESTDAPVKCTGMPTAHRRRGTRGLQIVRSRLFLDLPTYGVSTVDKAWPGV